jgi:L-fuconolactonase
MQIIDAHQHFWKYHPDKQTWIGEDMKVIQKDFLPNDLKEVLDRNNVQSCISVQVDQNKEETLFQLKCAAQNSFIDGVIGWIDLLDAKIFDEDLSFYNQHKTIKGFRHILQGAPTGFMLQESFINNLKKLGLNGYTYDLLIYNNQLSEAIALLNKIPDVPIVLNHIGKPNIKGEGIKEWVMQIKKIAINKNLNC